MYSEKVIQHFKNPHNQGRIDDPDATGQKGNLACGDVMKIYLKVINKENLDDCIIEDIKFETFGCAAAIAVTSAMTDLVKGKTLKDALLVTKDDIVEDLGGLPKLKIHCSMLGVDALHEAIKNYKNNI